MINFSEIRNRISVIGIELKEDGKGNIVTAMVDGGMAVENAVFTSMDTLREYVLKDMQNFDEERIKEANEGQMFDFIIPAGEPCPYCKTAHCRRRKRQIIFGLSAPADCAVSVPTAV